MPKTDGRTEYRTVLTMRLRKLRLAKDWTQAEMATALGVSEERYRKYEKRSWLPVYLLERLALVTGRSITYIVTGKEQRATPPSPPIPMVRPARRARS